MYDIENNMPKFIQRAVHAKRAVIKPTEGMSAGVHKVKLSSLLYIVPLTSVLYVMHIGYVVHSAACRFLTFQTNCRLDVFIVLK